MSKKKADDPEMTSQDITDGLSNAMLRETVEKLEEQKVTLLLNIKGLVDKLAQQKQDQSDIYFYLNKKLDDNYEVISALEDQILSEQSDREMTEKLFERRLEETRSKATVESQKLNSRIMDLEEKLQQLKEFSMEKEVLDTNLRELFETLESERDQYRISTDEIERKAALDREKMKHEYEQLIIEYRADIQKKVDAKLSRVTRNTSTINACMKHELKYQSSTVESMMRLTDNVMDKDKELRVELNIAQSNETEMLHRLATYQRIIKQLNERITQEIDNQAQVKSAHSGVIEEKEKQIGTLSEEIAKLHSFIDNENAQLDNVWKALSETYAYVQMRKKKPQNSSEPVDHDEVLCEVFYRLTKKYPNKFKSMLKDRISSRLSTAGSEVMSTCSSKDSLLFPKISSARGAVGGIPRSIDTGALNMNKGVLDKKSHSVPKSGVLSNQMEFSDEEEVAGSSSVVTGIPSWDKGLAKPDKEALWWLNQESSMETANVNDIDDSPTVSPRAASSSMRIGFADDSLMSVGKISPDVNVLSSLCQADESSKASPRSVMSSNMKHASVQTEGRVSVFPSDSVFNNPVHMDLSASWKGNSEEYLQGPASMIQKSVANFLQAHSTSPSKYHRNTDKSFSGNNSSKVSVSGESHGSQGSPSRIPSLKELSVPNINTTTKTRMIPVPPSFSSPIKNVLAVVPAYSSVSMGHNFDSQHQRAEAKRRVLHGRRVAPTENARESNYLQRNESLSSSGARSKSNVSANSVSDDDQSLAASLSSAVTTRTAGSTVVSKFKQGTPPVYNNRAKFETDRKIVNKKQVMKTFKLATDNSADKLT